jgi:hypothetical protein
MRSATTRSSTTCRTSASTGGPGDVTSELAALDIFHTGDTDGHNNLTFHSIRLLYNYGLAVRIGIDPATVGETVRGINFHDIMIHGGDGPGGSTSGSYTKLVPGMLIQDADNVHILGGRIHAVGSGQPFILLGHGAGKNGGCEAYVSNVSFGSVSEEEVTADVTSNVYTVTAAGTHDFGTGALVRTSATSTTDYFVIRLTASTFSLATTWQNAKAGTVATVSNGSGVTVTGQIRAMDLTGGTSTAGHIRMSSITNQSGDNRAWIIDRTGETDVSSVDPAGTIVADVEIV